MEFNETVTFLWNGLGWPLVRLIFFVSFGLLVANVIEAMNWTRAVSRLAAPLARLGNLSDVAGASFSMAFFSGISANTMLAEAYDQGKIGRRELVFANLFNSLPTYFLHLPTLFFITVPLIKGAAFIYVGLTLSAAVLRTFTVLLLGRVFLPRRSEGCVTCLLEENSVKGLRQALLIAWDRFRKRIRRIVVYTVPIYVLFFYMGHYGVFRLLEQTMAEKITVLSWLDPKSFGIVVLHIAAEFTAGLAAAGALLEQGTLGYRETVLALLVGNILSSPVRGIRHQFPFYAGIFPPRLAAGLIFFNQGFRAASLVAVCFGYYIYSLSLSLAG